MKFSLFASWISLIAAPRLAQCCGEKENATYPVPEECCCMSYKPACTMNQERMYHMKLYYNRKKGISPEEFNRYWANDHYDLVEPFHLRMGIEKMVQYHSTPEIRNLGRIEGGAPILEFDGAAEFWAHSLDTFQAMQSDPFYLETIVPDEANFIDHESLRLIIGVDYIVIENQNSVLDHGRRFDETL